MSIKIRVLQFKRGLLDRLTAAGILPGEPAIAWDDDTHPRLLIGDRMGVPRELAAPAHVHLISSITGLQAALDTKAWGGGGIAWSQLTDIPGVAAFTNDAGYLTGITNVMVTAALGFTPAHAVHTHLAEDLPAYPTLMSLGAVATSDPRLSNARTPLAHTHPTSDVTGLQSALDGKAAAAHAAAHAPGGSDTLPWTDIHGRGTTAAKPAPSALNAGYTYFDTNLGKQQRSNGFAWEDCEGLGVGGGGGSITTTGWMWPKVSSVPLMTSSTAPSGVASASSEYPGTPAWQAFSENHGGWVTNATGLSTPQWLQYAFTSAKIILSYSIQPWSNDTFHPRWLSGWHLDGSNDGTTWTTLDTRTAIIQRDWVPFLPNYYAVTAPGSYRYYRLVITANGGDPYVGLQNLGLYES